VDLLVAHIVGEHGAALTSRLRAGQAADRVGTNGSVREEAKTSSAWRQTGLRGRRGYKSNGADTSAPLLAPRHEIDGQRSYWKVQLDRRGGIDALRLVERVMPEFGDRQVRIAVCAFSLNFGDLLCVKGLYPTMPPYPFTPGFEASGVVIEVGKEV